MNDGPRLILITTTRIFAHEKWSLHANKAPNALKNGHNSLI